MIPWELAKHLSPRTRMLLEARLMCALTPLGLITLAGLLAKDVIAAPPGVADKLLTFCADFHVYRIEWGGIQGGD